MIQSQENPQGEQMVIQQKSSNVVLSLVLAAWVATLGLWCLIAVIYHSLGGFSSGNASSSSMDKSDKKPGVAVTHLKDILDAYGKHLLLTGEVQAGLKRIQHDCKTADENAESKRAYDCLMKKWQEKAMSMHEAKEKMDAKYAAIVEFFQADPSGPSVVEFMQLANRASDGQITTEKRDDTAILIRKLTPEIFKAILFDTVRRQSSVWYEFKNLAYKDPKDADHLKHVEEDAFMPLKLFLDQPPWRMSKLAQRRRKLLTSRLLRCEEHFN